MLLKENSSPGFIISPSSASDASEIFVFLSLLSVVFVVNVPITLYISFAFAAEILAFTSFLTTEISAPKFLRLTYELRSDLSLPSSIRYPSLSSAYVKLFVSLLNPDIDPFTGFIFHFSFAFSTIESMSASSKFIS